MQQNRPFYKTTHPKMTIIGHSMRLFDHKLVTNTQFYKAASPKKGWCKIHGYPGWDFLNFLVAKVSTPHLKTQEKKSFPPFSRSKKSRPPKKDPCPTFQLQEKFKPQLNFNENLNFRSFFLQKSPSLLFKS